MRSPRSAPGWPRTPTVAKGPQVAPLAVLESAVVGGPDEKRGETVKAFVSLHPGAAATSEQLIALCRERMAAYEYPRSVVLVDGLPRTVTRKILRRELRG